MTNPAETVEQVALRIVRRFFGGTPRPSLHDIVVEELLSARKSERERCAKICDAERVAKTDDDLWSSGVRCCAAAIAQRIRAISRDEHRAAAIRGRE